MELNFLLSIKQTVNQTHYRISMNKLKLNIFVLLIINSLFCHSGELTIPNTFVANTPALASEVNSNFTAVEVSVDDNAQDISSLQSTMAQLMFEYGNIVDDLEEVTEAMVDQQAEINDLNNTVASLQAEIVSLNNIAGSQVLSIQQLQQDLTAIENNTVLELDGLLRYSEINSYPTAEFTAVNVQVNNGTGTTDGNVNGLGNITIGYNETSINATYFCSDSSYDEEDNCINNGGYWDNNVRRGSHNLIVGKSNSYDDFGSIIGGNRNNSNGAYTFVAGSNNRVYADNSSIVGGGGNQTNAISSSISSGLFNSANGYASSISGGQYNVTLGYGSSVTGGYANTASGSESVVTGGEDNISSGEKSSVTGGSSNTASGHHSVVSGGFNRIASSYLDWRAGGLFEDQ